MARKSKEEKNREKLIRKLEKLLAKFEKKGVEVPPIGCPPVGGEDAGLPTFCPVYFDSVGLASKIPSLWASPITFRFIQQ